MPIQMTFIRGDSKWPRRSTRVEKNGVYSLDIDVGGTFTDGFFTDGTTVKTAKVLTTPHDVTEGFIDCVRLGSKEFGLDLDEFLRRTSVARLSTTIGTNLLVQRKGARVGLLVTAGAEKTLYGDEPSDALNRIVPADMVLGISEAVDDAGQLRASPDGDEVLGAIRTLIQKGAQIVVVSLRNAWRNPVNELAIRAMVRERYPIHYLRSVPVQLGVEVVHDRNDHARTNSALLNAYIHADMARALFRAEDKLREAGYARPLLIVHASGGNARVAKTVALNTLHSGPAVAVKGAAELCRWLDLDHVISGDMGGTSFDVGLVLGRGVTLEPEPRIDNLRVATPTIQLGSIGLGGGSIAWVDGNTLKVGPESAGSAPGPVCYGKGGTEPTVTDANLVLGFIDADNFLGGRMKLDCDGARRAIERRLCRKLGIPVEEAAYRIRAAADARMATEIKDYGTAHGIDPADITLFSVGGAGPLHACEIAEVAGLKQVVTFPFGSVFSAFGGGTTDVQHLYRFTFGQAPGGASDIAPVVHNLILQAGRDMQGEGFGADAVQLTLQAKLDRGSVEIKDAAAHPESEVAARLWKQAAGAKITELHLAATSVTPHWQQKPSALKSNGAAPRATRPVWWNAEGAVATKVFDRDTLRPGAVIGGPAIVEGADTTYAVRPGWTLAVNEFGFFVTARQTGIP
jgi:N-methylhydantoinase A